MNQNPLENLTGENDQAVSPLVFVPVDQYTTFRAEYASADADLVFHFYVKTKDQVGTYWEKIFPHVLEVIAKEIFRADYPRLKAKRVDEFEIDSWWFRAYGFGEVPDPLALVRRFLDGLDRALDKKNEK